MKRKLIATLVLAGSSAVFATPALGESDTHCVSVHVIDWYIELRNECDRDVHYKYCIVNANTSGKSLIGAGPGAALHDCEGKIGGGAGRISAGGRSTAVQSDALGENSEFRWFACALPRLPEDWDWKTNRGYCRTAKESAAARRKGGGSGDVPSATREDRRAIQTALKAEGFDPGPADGQFGPKTQAAIKAWQQSIGQEQTGQLTANQMRRLLPGRLEEPEQAQQATATAGGSKKDFPGGSRDLWGSIAFSEESGGGYAYAIVWNSGGQEAAYQKAVDSCRQEGGSSCAEIGWFRNACGALALDKTNASVGYGTGWGDGTGTAEAMALRKCRSAGNTNCQIEVSRCSDAELETAGVGEPAVSTAEAQIAGHQFRDCEGCPEMVVVPEGSFRMGSPESEEGRWDDEGPVHRVAIGYRLAVGVHEVTRGEFARFVEATGRSMGNVCWAWEGDEWKERSGRHWRNPGFGQTDGHPVVCVSWDDAKAYVRWLSGETGEAYRLLSESEWEYVARAGTGTARYWGESERGQCRYANGADASTDFGWRTGCNDGHARTSPVGSYEANGYGLHDVLGNVWEWVEDCWNDSYRGAPEDGSAWVSGDCERRVLRGGSWINRPENLRSAERGRNTSGYRSNNFGFRVARTLN